MCTLGAMPAARACNAWARPISPPSAVTAALFDMFCGLKGRTSRPRRVNRRAKPATISDFPTSEPVPWNMTALAGMRALFHDERNARNHHDNAVGGARDLLVQPTLRIPEAPAQGCVGHDAEPNLVGYEDDRAGRSLEYGHEPFAILVQIAIREEAIAEP